MSCPELAMAEAGSGAWTGVLNVSVMYTLCRVPYIEGQQLCVCAMATAAIAENSTM